MAEGFRVAAAFVEVHPDTEGFREELQAALEEATAGTHATARIALDTSEFDARVDEARARLDSLESSRVEPSVHLNDEDLAARVDEARERLDELDSRSARPDVGLGTEDVDARLDEVHARLESLNAERVSPRVSLDTSEFQEQLGAAQAELAALGQESASPRVYARDARGRFTSGSSSQRSGEDAEQAVEDALSDGERRYRRDSRGRFVGAGGGGEEPALPGGSGGGGGLLSRIGNWFRGGGSGGSGSGESGEGFEMPEIPGSEFMQKALGWTSLGTVLSPAIGGTAMGAGLLGGAGILGLSGIAGAVSAAHQASMNIGMTPQQVAATQFSNQVGVQQAQDQVGQAHMQAAQDAVTSAAQIEQAQMNLASVERNAAESQVQALESVKQAQQGVEEANYSLSQAQYNLNQAWEAAKEQIRELNDQLADGKLSVQSAQLAIQQAIYNQRLVDQNAYSTSIQRQQAALAVLQAQQQLKDSQDQLTASQYQANLVNKQGLDGNQQVIQAKQALTQAQYGQQNAQWQAANAQRQLTLTELNNAAQVKQATLSLRMAQEQAAYQRQQDARNEAIAQRNLANTIKEQQLQWAATKSTENQAALQFQRDMSRLSPAARGVVTQILGMKNAFHGLTLASQTAIAPGLSVFLTGASKLMPNLTSGMSRMGSVISGAFASIGKAMQTPAGAKVFDGLINNGIKLAQTVVPAVGHLVGALGQIGAKKGAVDGVAGLIAGIAGGLTNAVRAVSPFTGALSTVFGTLGKALEPIGSLLGTVLGSLAQALAPILQALLPGVQALAGALGQGLPAALQGLGPMLAPVAQMISAVLQAASPLLPVLGQLVGRLAQALTPVLQAIVPIIRQLAGLLAKDLVDGLLQVVTNLMPIVPAAGKLITSLMPVVSLVLDLAGVLIGLAAKIIGPVASALAWLVSGILDLASHWKVAVGWIETAGLWLWHNVFDPMFHGIAQGAVWLYDFGIYPLWTSLKTAFGWIESAASWLWHNVFDPLWQGITGGVRSFLSTFQTIWDTLKSIFENPVSFVIDTVYNNGIVKLWDDIAGAFGASSLELKPIQGFRDGGPVTGGTPGKDSVPAMLMPGERVLSVPQVQKLGGQSGIDAMVGAAQPSYQGGVAYAAGGWSWNPLTDLAKLGSSVWDGLKGVVLGGLRDAATPVIDGLEKLAKTALGTTGVGGMLDQGVDTTGTAILTFLGGKDAGAKAGGGAIGGTVPTGQRLSIIDQALAAAGVPPPGTKEQWEAGLNTLITRESGWNLLAVNNWDINAQEGHPSTGLAQVILPTFLEYVPASLKGRPLTDAVANVAAAVRYIVADYGTISNVQQANANMPPKGYDSGGLAYGVGALAKYTPLPERVLSPRQTEAFERLVAWLDRQSGAGAVPGKQPVVINFNGTQYPNAEQMAAIQREMGLALSGG